MKKKKLDPDDKEQSARFIETARQLDIDQSSGVFERAFKAIAPKKSNKPKRDQPRSK